MDQDANDDGLGALLRSTVSRLQRRFRSERGEGTLADGALEVLSWLHKVGPQTLTELSEQARVAPSSMSQTVNRLASGGYAVRTPDAHDRRKVRFSSTPEGASLVVAARGQRNGWLDARLEALSVDDQAVIARACTLLGAIADS